MNEQTWIDARVNRADWGPGEWDGEPDKVQWTDEATGLVCLAKRNPRSGNWCGYVGVAPGHAWHGKYYDDLNVDVHGGLTFADACQDGPPEQTICHVPEPGQPAHLWWLGFDCHHAYDLAPGTRAFWRSRGETMFESDDESYRPLTYVKRECKSLAKQVANLGMPADSASEVQK